MNVIRNVLDHQLVDRNHMKMGRVDGITIELRQGQAPRLAYIEMGMPTLARRLHPRLEPWIAALQNRWGAKQKEPFLILWSQVSDFNTGGLDIQVDLEAKTTPALAWENWLRKHVIRRIPGAEK